MSETTKILDVQKIIDSEVRKVKKEQSERTRAILQETIRRSATSKNVFAFLNTKMAEVNQTLHGLLTGNPALKTFLQGKLFPVSVLKDDIGIGQAIPIASQECALRIVWGTNPNKASLFLVRDYHNEHHLMLNWHLDDNRDCPNIKDHEYWRLDEVFWGKVLSEFADPERLVRAITRAVCLHR